jgi:hypothetical protein
LFDWAAGRKHNAEIPTEGIHKQQLQLPTGWQDGQDNSIVNPLAVP